MRALVIGNGESRKNIDIFAISKNYITVGCNALHRDFIPDHLVCCDNRMVIEALSNSNDVPRIYTRERYYRDHRKIAKNKNVFRLPELPYEGQQKQDQPIHWGSGPYAILLACKLGFTEINLLGFDLYGTDNKVNNIYKDTTNYNKKTDRPVDCSYWIYQIAKIFQHFKNNTFFIYNIEDWNVPYSWVQGNVCFENISKLCSLTLNTRPV